MQSWKFNSIANYSLRIAIATSLNIPFSDVYKTVRDIDNNGFRCTVKTKNGKKYKLVLEEI